MTKKQGAATKFAFSKAGDSLLAQSIELDRQHDNAEPGTMYMDPVWGLCQVPYRDLDLGEKEPGQ